jgi:hypothetical protein
MGNKGLDAPVRVVTEKLPIVPLQVIVPEPGVAVSTVVVTVPVVEIVAPVESMASEFPESSEIVRTGGTGGAAKEGATIANPKTIDATMLFNLCVIHFLRKIRAVLGELGGRERAKPEA